MLEGNTTDLRLVGEDDLPLLSEWSKDADYLGNCVSLPQQSKTKWEKRYDSLPADTKWFFIERKDGTKIGTMFYWLKGGLMEISCILHPDYRKKGYGTEATQLMVDYLFLSTNITRIQADTNARNKTAQETLKRAGFKKEGTMRKYRFVRGVWTDYYLYSVLREEWKEPKILSTCDQSSSIMRNLR